MTANSKTKNTSSKLIVENIENVKKKLLTQKLSHSVFISDFAQLLDTVAGSDAFWGLLIVGPCVGYLFLQTSAAFMKTNPEKVT